MFTLAIVLSETEVRLLKSDIYNLFQSDGYSTEVYSVEEAMEFFKEMAIQVLQRILEENEVNEFIIITPEKCVEIYDSEAMYNYCFLPEEVRKILITYGYR